MRPLGIVAAILTVISFLFWLSGWVFWNFLASEYAAGVSASMIMQAISALSSAIEYLALLLICIGLFVGGKHAGASAE